MKMAPISYCKTAMVLFYHLIYPGVCVCVIDI